MKPDEIRQMTQADVEEQLSDREEELSNLRMRLVTHQLDNPLRIREVRRELARLKTILRERQLGLHAPSGDSVPGSGAETSKER